jgi:DNA-binding transcriptional MerR regulator
MRIGELSRRTDIPTRMLRYYEEKHLLQAEREGNGYRSYPASAAGLALQIRGLLDSGLTTEIIREILPCLDDPATPDGQRLTPGELAPETAAALGRHLDRVQQRIDCLSRNRDAIRSYIDAARHADHELRRRSEHSVGASAL